MCARDCDHRHVLTYCSCTLSDANALTFLAAGSLASLPAAALCTPIDVIKTRLQVRPVEGQSSYSGILDAAANIWRTEGARTFWKGIAARMMRMSLQFGCTMTVYEELKRVFHVDFAAWSG